MSINKETLDKWRNDSKNWIWGVFYYNPEDIRVFPPKKKEEIGFTINFANPKSIMALLAAFTFFGMVIYFIFRNK